MKFLLPYRRYFGVAHPTRIAVSVHGEISILKSTDHDAFVPEKQAS